MAENKTQKTKASVEKFLSSIKDKQQRADSEELVNIMKSVSKAEPKMWGPAIIGFGDHHYKYDSGREGDFFQIGFSPRKQSLVLYLMSGISYLKDNLKKLGKYKTGKGCLYVKTLNDIDRKELKSMLSASLKKLNENKKA